MQKNDRDFSFFANESLFVQIKSTLEYKRTTVVPVMAIFGEEYMGDYSHITVTPPGGRNKIF